MNDNSDKNKLRLPAQAFLNTCFFDLSTMAGRTVNLLFMLLVIGSVVISMFGTVKSVSLEAKADIESFEILVTYIFAVEYILRIYAAKRRKEYALSYNGLIDLLTWAPLLVFGVMTLPIRLLRILRLLKLLRYMRALKALFSSMSDITHLVFVVVSSIAIIVIVFGYAMFLLEPETFPNAFIGSWWSLITMTTVGYGDIVPQTAFGKAMAAVLILIGISMFAVLTGTISARLSEHLQHRSSCTNCNLDIPVQSYYCLHCGTKLPLTHGRRAGDQKKEYSPLEEEDKQSH